MADEPKRMAGLAYRALEEKKAEDIRVIGIGNVSVLADYFVIANGNSPLQVEAMVDSVQEELAKDPAFAFICYVDANYTAKSFIKGISADTVLGHHGVGIFWNVAEWTM